ncbi:MAG: hypothetical protein M3Z29_08875 [Pseudomonadota bacterium]|nr:hypothetical protein [Pseudomonadota bacterium]
MIVFRWIVGVLSAILATGTVVSFAIGIGFDAELWLQRTRHLRHWLWLLLLLWFNTEVWGRVGYTLLHWTKG